MSSPAAYRHTRHDVRTGERPSALLRDPRFRPAARAAPRRRADHRPVFRSVAQAPRGDQAGDRGGVPGSRAHRRPRPPDDDRGAGRRRGRAARPPGDRGGRFLRFQPRRPGRVRGRAWRARPGRQADRRLRGRPPPARPGEPAPRRGPPADTGRLRGVARRLPGGRSRPRALQRAPDQDGDRGARVPGVDRRVAFPSGTDPAAVRRPGLHAAARRGGDVPAPAGRATRGAPRGHPHGRQPARRRGPRADHAVPRPVTAGRPRPGVRRQATPRSRRSGPTRRRTRRGAARWRRSWTGNRGRS